MHCSGGVDINMCQMPDFCYPSIHLMGKDGLECPAYCPMKCGGPDEMWCEGGKDWNDCPMPDFCMQKGGWGIGKDGSECPAYCPVKCGPEDMPCFEGNDENGCMRPESCQPAKGPMGKDGFE